MGDSFFDEEDDFFEDDTENEDEFDEEEILDDEDIEISDDEDWAETGTDDDELKAATELEGTVEDEVWDSEFLDTEEEEDEEWDEDEEEEWDENEDDWLEGTPQWEGDDDWE